MGWNAGGLSTFVTYGTQLSHYSGYVSVNQYNIVIPEPYSVFPLLATSVDVERVFSKGRLVLSHIRNRLTVASTRALMCLGAWSILGLVEDADIKAVANLPDVMDDDDDNEIRWD